MATRADYRSKLNNKILGLEDEGYGDFEYTDTELNTFLEFSVSRLFPAVYKRVAADAVEPTSYGTSFYGYVTHANADRVFLVEDSTELTPITGWRMSSGRILGLDTSLATSVILHYIDAFELPEDDVTDAEIPAIYTPLVVLGALIEALESRHDTGIRGEPPPTGQHYETQLIDRLQPRYDRLKEELSMALPGVVL
jgi:hypothetical protein